MALGVQETGAHRQIVIDFLGERASLLMSPISHRVAVNWILPFVVLSGFGFASYLSASESKG